MKHYLENSQPFMAAIAKALEHDPASLQHWFCLYLPVSTQVWASGMAMPSEAILGLLNRQATAVEGSLVLCEDQDIVMIVRGLDKPALLRLGRLVTELAMGCPRDSVALCVYDLCQEARMARQLFLSKAGLAEPDPSKLLCQSENPFSLEQATDDVFKDSCSQRAVRTPLHVLLVEDDPLTRRVAASLMKDDYVLRTAADAEEALAEYMVDAPDLVFLDINLPGANGFSLLEHLKKADPEAYVVMFSGQDSLDNIVTSLVCGAKGFVTKPFRRERLRHYLTGREALQVRERGVVFPQ